MKFGTKVLARIILMTAIAAAVFGFTFASAENYEIYVAGTQVTSDNAGDVLGDGTVSYDAATSTLTFKDANIEYEECGIEAACDITVTGTVTFTTNDDSIYMYQANIAIKDATLTCNSQNDARAIAAWEGEIVIDNSTVSIKSDSSGLYSYNGCVNISGSTIDVESYKSSIYADYCSKDVIIKDSELVLKSEDSFGIDASNSGVVIENSTVSIEDDYIGIYVGYTDAGCTIKNSEIDIKSENYDGINTEYSDITIENSIVKIEAGEDGISTSATVYIVDSTVIIDAVYGIWGYCESGEFAWSLNVKGSEVSIFATEDAIDTNCLEVTDSIINCESEKCGIWANKIIVNSGYIHSAAKLRYAVCTTEEIIYEKPYGIYSPSDAKVLKVGDGEDSKYHIVPADVDAYKNSSEGDNACHDVIITAEFTVTWAGADDKTIATDKYIYGQTPEFKGTAPTKAADDKYTYEFTGWDKEISKVTGDVTYKAVFKAIDKPAEKKDVAPKTGDAENVLALMGIAVLAMAGAVVAFLCSIIKNY